jgi:hypothetical protein
MLMHRPFLFRSKQALIDAENCIGLRARYSRTLARYLCKIPGACPGILLILILFLACGRETLRGFFPP